MQNTDSIDGLIDALVDELMNSDYLDNATKAAVEGFRVGAKEDLKRMPPEEQESVVATFLSEPPNERTQRGQGAGLSRNSYEEQGERKSEIPYYSKGQEDSHRKNIGSIDEIMGAYIPEDPRENPYVSNEPNQELDAQKLLNMLGTEERSLHKPEGFDGTKKIGYQERKLHRPSLYGE